MTDTGATGTVAGTGTEAGTEAVIPSSHTTDSTSVSAPSNVTTTTAAGGGNDGQVTISTTAASAETPLAGTGHESSTPMDIDIDGVAVAVADSTTITTTTNTIAAVTTTTTTTTTTTSATLPVRFSLVNNSHKKHLSIAGGVNTGVASYPNNKASGVRRSLLHIHASFSNLAVDE